MIEKLIKWLLGDRYASSIGGILAGAATGAVTVAATGNLDSKSLMIGAAGGAVAALSGSGGRMMGEK